MATTDYSMFDAAARSAYIALARRLAHTVGLDLQGLADDLDMLGSTQPEAAWQESHGSLADVLRLVAVRPAQRAG